MKKHLLISITLLLFSVISFAQQASEVDSKFVRLPRYANLTAIQSAIPTAQQGMMVYNIGTASNWYYNGTTWTNMLSAAGSSAWISSAFGIYPTNINQNVGIGMDQPVDKLEVNGNVAIMNNGSLEFGKYISGKETNAGRMGYGLFTPNTLDIVGAGNTYLERKIRFWAEGGSTFEGKATFNGNVGVGTNTPNQKLEVNGKIKIADDAIAPVAGNIRYNSTTNDFEGFNGTVWKSFTQPTGFWGSLNAVISEVGPSSVIPYGNITEGTAKAMVSDNYMALLFKEAAAASSVVTKFYKWENNNWVFMNQLAGNLMGKMTDNWLLKPNTLGETSSITDFSLYRRNNNLWEFHSIVGSVITSTPYGKEFDIDGNKLVLKNLGAIGSTTDYIDIYQFNGSAWVLQQTITDPSPAVGNDFGYTLRMKKEYIGIGYGNSSSNTSLRMYKYNGSSFVSNSLIFQKYVQAIHFEGASVRVQAFSIDLGSTAGGSGGIYKINTGGFWELIPDTQNVFGSIEGFAFSIISVNTTDGIGEIITLNKYENDQYLPICDINYTKLSGSENFGTPILNAKTIIIPSKTGYQLFKRP